MIYNFPAKKKSDESALSFDYHLSGCTKEKNGILESNLQGQNFSPKFYKQDIF